MLRVSNQQFVNYCYVVIDMVTRNAVAIDPAWDMKAVIEVLSSYGAQLNSILLTHHHDDHTHLADPLATYYGANVVVSKQEADVYGLKYRQMEVFDGDVKLNCQGVEVQTLLTPGHTQGGVCYLIADACFTGDTLFNEGCGACFWHGADPREMFDSLQKIKNSLHGNVRIYPGHRYGTELGQPFSYLLEHNIYLRIEDVESFVAYRMRKNQTQLFSFQ
jgi:glyoxylase-like metal-dependent hydrolase (beta-lactamase superfamily II)